MATGFGHRKQRGSPRVRARYGAVVAWVNLLNYRVLTRESCCRLGCRTFAEDAATRRRSRSRTITEHTTTGTVTGTLHHGMPSHTDVTPTPTATMRLGLAEN